MGRHLPLPPGRLRQTTVRQGQQFVSERQRHTLLFAERRRSAGPRSPTLAGVAGMGWGSPRRPRGQEFGHRLRCLGRRPGHLPWRPRVRPPPTMFEVQPFPWAAVCNPNVASTAHPKGIVVGMADASSHTISPRLDIEEVWWAGRQWRRFQTRARRTMIRVVGPSVVAAAVYRPSGLPLPCLGRGTPAAGTGTSSPAARRATTPSASPPCSPRRRARSWPSARAARPAARDHGDIDLVLKRSTDGGKTWGPLQLVHEEGGDAKITIGNPCPVVDRDTGTDLAALHAATTTTSSYPQHATTAETWAKPAKITEAVKKPVELVRHRARASASSCGTGRTRAGWSSPATTRPRPTASRRRYSHVIYSDDHGKTWKLGGDGGAAHQRVPGRRAGRRHAAAQHAATTGAATARNRPRAKCAPSPAARTAARRGRATLRQGAGRAGLPGTTRNEPVGYT